MRRIFNTVILLCLGLLAGEGGSALAQGQPPQAAREALADSLNAALSRGDTIVTISDPIVVDDGIGGCDTLMPGNIRIYYFGGYIVLCRILSDEGVLPIPTQHQLVDDLNNWLNRVWAMDLKAFPEFDTLGWDCDNRFYTDTTSMPTLVDKVIEESGENEMLEKDYLINGSVVQGSSLLDFEESSPRVLRYVTDLGDGTPSADSIRRLAEGYVKVSCSVSNTFSFKWQLTTRKYTDDCGISTETDFARLQFYYNDSAWCAADYAFKAVDTNNHELVSAYQQTMNGWVYPYDTVDLMTREYVDTLGAFLIDSEGYLTFVTFHSRYCGPSQRRICKLVDTVAPAEYCKAAYCYPGAFSIDPATGMMVYTPESSTNCGSCSTQPVPCLAFCDEILPEQPVISQVVRASSLTFDDDWPYDGESIASPPPLSNVYEQGLRGKWRTSGNYAYRTTIKQGTGHSGDPGAIDERNYNDAGVFDMTLFDWRDEDRNDPVMWLRTSTVTRYSPHGEGVEEKDVLDIYSAARFGYGGKLPVLVAKNAGYGAVAFEAFEDGKGNTEDYAHSGFGSYELPASGTTPVLARVTLDQQVIDEGLLIRIWAKRSYPTPLSSYVSGKSPMKIIFTPDGGSPVTYYDPPAIDSIAKTGEWALYELKIESISPAYLGHTADIAFEDNLSSEVVWIDDLRIQPMLSEMVCYVYDINTLRLSAQFDDQHFGNYYQYNGEGKLVRTMRETERGLKSVQEAQYHTPLVAFTDPYTEGTTGGGGVPSSRIAPSRSEGWENGPAASPATTSGARFDLLNVELGVDDQDVKILGVEPYELGDRAERLLEILSLPSVDSLELPRSDKLVLAQQLQEADERLHSLDLKNAESDSERERIEEERRKIETKRAEVIRRLGITEEDLRSLDEGSSSRETRDE